MSLRASLSFLVLVGCGDDAGTGGASGQSSSGQGPSTSASAAGPTSGTTSSGAGTGGGAPVEVWSPLATITIVDPMDHGAVGDGAADDLGALEASVDALPDEGGIVFVRPGATFRKTDVFYVEKSHVKLWSPDRQGTIHSEIAGVRRRSGVIFRDVDGAGSFGVKYTSDAQERFDALEDNQIATDGATRVEIVGNEIDGSPAAGVFLYGASREIWINGNFVHHTWADHVHHTAGSRTSWVWGNFFRNEDPSKGDDGIACVTYAPTDPKCGDMEWWGNVHLGGTWGRGYAVVGGDHVFIHHNWAVGTAGASLLLASESGTAAAEDVVAEDNWFTGSSQIIGHPTILVSGANAAAPVKNVTLRRNVAVNGAHGDYREEGAFENVVVEDLSTDANDLPGAVPTLADVAPRATAILATRDTSYVAEPERRGLYRIEVRQAPGGGFEERFVYVVRGSTVEVDAFVAARVAGGDALVEQRADGATAIAVVMTRAPVVASDALSGIGFADLRAGALDGSLAWLWERLGE